MDAALRSLIDWYARAGVDVPALTPARPTRKKRAAATTQTTRQVEPTPSSKTTDTTQSNLDISALIETATQNARKAQSLDDLRAGIESFNAGRLSDNARGAVFARGNPVAKLMVIGEAPSAEDDVKGAPFSGREGSLLGRMLGAIGLSEDDYYLTLTVNWRLPQSRMVKPDEIDICRPFLRRHIELVAPAHILMLGSTPLTALTDTPRIMREHGQWKRIKSGKPDNKGQEIPALPIYPPSTLLTQADLKKDAWRDLLTLRAALEGAA